MATERKRNINLNDPKNKWIEIHQNYKYLKHYEFNYFVYNEIHNKIKVLQLKLVAYRDSNFCN